MCVVSMIMDHYYDWWRWRAPQPLFPITVPIYPPHPPPVVAPVVPVITPQEIEEFRKLLERAREYDRKHNEPDCELEEKRQKLLHLAEELGIAIDFV